MRKKNVSNTMITVFAKFKQMQRILLNEIRTTCYRKKLKVKLEASKAHQMFWVMMIGSLAN